MSKLRQTTLPFVAASSSGQALDAARRSSSPRSASKASTPKTSSSSYSSKSAPTTDERDHLRQLARNTLASIDRGGYLAPSGRYINIRTSIDECLQGTLFYPPNAFDKWKTQRPHGRAKYVTEFRVREVTTVQAAQELATEAQTFAAESNWGPPAPIGILNFASATKPGGGFKNGAKAQEESIARVSSLYASLTTPTGLQFYKKDIRSQEGATYSHSMVYSPQVIVFSTDDGITLESPYEISVVTSPAVNAGVVREQNMHQDEGKVERAIARIMKERMGRILALFEDRGDKWLVLGSYGTGVFRNPVETVAGIWAELLLRDDSRFSGVFERVDFAIVGRDTYERFLATFH